MTENREMFREGTAEGMMAAAQGMGAGKYAAGAMGAAGTGKQKIGREEIKAARDTLEKYKSGKKALEQRIIENERWYKVRHWESLRKDKSSAVEPTSAWLFNVLANKHADAMDNFPSPNVLPREEGDKAEAEMLSSILPVVLEQNDFEATYDMVCDDNEKNGTGVYGVFWDGGKLNGLGDVAIRYIDVLNLFWEPGISNIQDSRNVFHAEMQDNDLLEEQYPQVKGHLGNGSGQIGKHETDDSVDESNKSAVIDWYYHRNGVLHYCKFVEDVVLFATENEEEYAQTGWYEHGKFPFVFAPLHRVKGSPCGFGYIDIAKSAQEYIDRGNKAIMENMMANARPRHFIRNDGGVNEEEYGDYTKDFVHVEGGIGPESIMAIPQNPMQGTYLTIIQNKIDELKEVTGNRDISTGGSSSGVTAASAIAAMQEAGSKLSRDSNKKSYRAFREVVLMVIELIRQFYTMPRYFRVLGEEGAAKFVEYTNTNINSEKNGGHMPLFDVQITAQKQSPYSKMSQNELALQFYSAGFFNPGMADQALACLDMMDFDRKSFIINKISQNGTLMQMVQRMQAQMVGMAAELDRRDGGNRAMQMMQQFGGGGQAAPMGGEASAENQEALGADNIGESGVTKNARQRVADSTAPT